MIALLRCRDRVKPAQGCAGFTLAELAVALVIVGLLLAGTLIPLSTQIEVRNISDTRRTMDGIREAIIGFAQANGRLPCPADGSIADGISGAGAELYNVSSCTTAIGVVPWATLGVPETDAWGRRFTYRVTPAFADAIGLNTWQSRATAIPGTFPSQSNTAVASPGDQNPTCPSSSSPAVAPYTLLPTPALSSFALCSLGDIAVLTRSVSATAAVTLGSALAAVFISHGKNGYGAWQSNGTRLNPQPGADDEASNVNGTTQVTTAVSGIGYTQQAFFSRDPTPSASGCSDPAPGAGASASPLCEFDDIVVMISVPTLIARTVSAGRLP